MADGPECLLSVQEPGPARSSGERLGKVLSELARRSLAPAAVPPRKSSRRFPTFDVPPGSPVIPAWRIHRVIDEMEGDL
jgi:hypothetical protein